MFDILRILVYAQHAPPNLVAGYSNLSTAPIILLQKVTYDNHTESF